MRLQCEVCANHKDQWRFLRTTCDACEAAVQRESAQVCEELRAENKTLRAGMRAVAVALSTVPIDEVTDADALEVAIDAALKLVEGEGNDD